MSDISFTQKIYDLARQIPRGKVVTYGQLARMAGSPKAARAVGMIMKMNPDAPQTPCHRVVAHNGDLTGYSGTNGIAGKKAMLLEEGVVFNSDKVNLAVSQWQPHHTR